MSYILRVEEENDLPLLRALLSQPRASFHSLTIN